MECRQFKNSMIYFIEGDLDAQQSEQFKTHLDTCLTCKQLYEKFYSDYKLLTTDKITESNPFFYTRVMATLNKETNEGIIARIFTKKTLVLQFASYIIAGFMAIAAGYLIANDKSQNNMESIKEQMEMADQQLFAESHNLSLTFDDVYIINANETGE